MAIQYNSIVKKIYGYIVQLSTFFLSVNPEIKIFNFSTVSLS